MQKYILSRKHEMMTLSAVLIVVAFGGKFLFNKTVLAETALVLASMIGVIPIAIQAYQALRVRVVSIDVLVSIAVGGAFMIRNFEESAIVSFLFLFGAFLEQRTLNKTRSAIKELIAIAPDSALKQMADGEFVVVDIDEVDVGDRLLVKTGARIPVDGTVSMGNGYVNEASITGESRLVTKEQDSMVYAGSILENGTLQIIANRVGEETTFGKIIELVEEAQDSKSEAQRFIDRFSKYYTPFVLVLALVVGLVSLNIELAITILVLGCPGALVIGVPVSNVAGIGNGARQGILLKGSEFISVFSKVDTMVFDKTGTLTDGKLKVTETIVYIPHKKVQSYLASVEMQSDHPLAQAVIDSIGPTTTFEVTHTEVIKGGGIRAEVDSHQIVVGNVALMNQQDIYLNETMQSDIKRLEDSGHSLVLTAIDGQVAIIMAVRDQIRTGVQAVLERLKQLGVNNLILLSGDNQGTVDLVAQKLQLTQAYGHMLPEDKAAYIKNLQAQGHNVAFVGDGVNDSPSLALAQVGIAMGSGTDVAIETSDVVLMNDDMHKLPIALSLVKAIHRNMKENILIAIGVVILLLVSVFFSDWMNMSIGMFVHEASILVVIINAMRLLNYKNKGDYYETSNN